jgi:hypothetical protein
MLIPGRSNFFPLPIRSQALSLTSLTGNATKKCRRYRRIRAGHSVLTISGITECLAEGFAGERAAWKSGDRDLRYRCAFTAERKQSVRTIAELSIETFDLAGYVSHECVSRVAPFHHLLIRLAAELWEWLHSDNSYVSRNALSPDADLILL